MIALSAYLSSSKMGEIFFLVGANGPDRINRAEGSHSGLVRPPAKRLPGETGILGSNPSPSASHTKSTARERGVATYAEPRYEPGAVGVRRG